MINKNKVGLLGVVFIALCLIGGCESKARKISDNGSQVKESNQVDNENNTELKNERKQDTTVNAEQKSMQVNIYCINEETGMLETKEAQISDEKDIWRQLQNTGIITEDCQLLEFSLNESEKKIDLDFNKTTGDRIRSMGTTGESEILACIINTYLETYDCDGIKLTEEGKVLQTSHGANYDGYSGIMSF